MNGIDGTPVLRARGLRKDYGRDAVAARSTGWTWTSRRARRWR